MSVRYSYFFLVAMFVFALTTATTVQAAPVFQAAGAAVSGTGSVSPAWPAQAINDVALLFVESTGGQPATLSTPAGFVAVANSPQATGTTTNGTQITVFWARATSSSMAAPTVADPGDHVYAQIITYRGVVNTGNPWDVTGGGVKAAASTSVTVSGVTTTVPDTLIVQGVTRDTSSAAAAFSAETNAVLTGIAERSDAGTVSGNGGGFAVWDGVMAAAGATGNTTATVTSSVNAFLTIALNPGPIVTSINRASANPTAPGTAIAWTVVFNRSVTGVDATDFTLVATGGVSGAAITSVTGAGTTWTVNANTGSYGGTIGLNLVDDDTIIDAGGVKLGGTGAGNGNFTGQVYTDTAPFCSPPSNTPVGLTLSCVCDTFARATLNPSTIFNGNWIVSTSDQTGILPSIVNPGYLRLTNNTGNNAKAVTVPGIFPATGNYISIEFQQYAYNGSGADGIAVTLSDYSVPAVPGAFGGSLGYAQKTGAACNTASCPGFAGGWIGVALDEFGNYQNPTEGRIGGPGQIAESVGVRGSGTGNNGYNWIAGTNGLNPLIDNKGSTTPSLGNYYQVIVDARNDPTSTSVSVNRDTGSGYSSLINIPNTYSAATAQGFTQSPVPANWQISFTGSTGGSANIHEISGLRICAQTSVPTSGGTPGGFNAVDTGYGNPPLAVQNYNQGHIYAKLAGTSFNLNVAALNNSQILTTYAAAAAKNVTVRLVDNSDSISNSALDCTQSCTSTCTSKSTVTDTTASQTVTFTAGATDKGQKQTGSFTLDKAWQKLVAIISDGTVTACSTDNFSVRPPSLTASATTSGGSGLASTISGATGAPTVKAGANFTINANSGIVGYTGTPQLDNTKASDFISSTTPLTILSGSFNAANVANGNSSGTNFQYSDVGYFVFNANTVYDSNWTSVDQGTKSDCIANSISNVIDTSGTNSPTNGKYGCNVGSNAISGGRFIPDHFALSSNSIINRADIAGSTDTFTYLGEQLIAVFTLTAQSQSGSTTQNYKGAYAKLDPSVFANVQLGAVDRTTVLTPPPPYLLSPLISATGMPVVTCATTPCFPNTGTPGVASAITVPFKFTRAAAPAGPYGVVDVGINPIDSDGVTVPFNIDTTTATNPAVTMNKGKVGSTVLRYGRMLIPNMYGSELLNLSVNVTAQYWGGTSYLPNTLDNRTPLLASNFSMANQTGGITAANMNMAGNFPVPVPSILTAGSGQIILNMPTPVPAGKGSVDLSTTGTVGAYLPGTGHETFGVYKSGPFIFIREIY